VRILFLDAVARNAYDDATMRKQGLGGTEASVVHVVTGLSALHEVAVAQRGRTEAARPQVRLRYLPLGHPDPFDGPPPDCVVVVRKHRYIPRLRARYPTARMLLWIQNWQHAGDAVWRVGLARSGCDIVTVSEVHRAATDRLVNGSLVRLLGALTGGGGKIAVRRIYNPVDEQPAADATLVDRDKLVFYSNKGITQVLRTFGQVRRQIPSLRLYVAGISLQAFLDSAAHAQDLARQEGVHLLGRLPHDALFRHVRESLCVFYPQDELSETFGVIFAESNALGTPVLAHDFGAAREVLGSPDQLVDARDLPAIVAKLRSWRAGNRPRVTLRPEFRLSSVIAQWRALLEGAGSAPHAAI
jgi:glycosyltransferase involved in cell wall biosynthesis